MRCLQASVWVWIAVAERIMILLWPHRFSVSSEWVPLWAYNFSLLVVIAFHIVRAPQLLWVLSMVHRSWF